MPGDRFWFRGAACRTAGGVAESDRGDVCCTRTRSGRPTRFVPRYDAYGVKQRHLAKRFNEGTLGDATCGVVRI